MAVIYITGELVLLHIQSTFTLPHQSSHRVLISRNKIKIALCDQKFLTCIVPPNTPDDFIDKLESCVTCILDNLAPVRTGHRPNGHKGCHWLSEDVVTAKRQQVLFTYLLTYLMASLHVSFAIFLHSVMTCYFSSLRFLTGQPFCSNTLFWLFVCLFFKLCFQLMSTFAGHRSLISITN